MAQPAINPISSPPEIIPPSPDTMKPPAEVTTLQAPPQPKEGTPTSSGENTTMIPHPPEYFAEALGDAERLLKYAAEVGITIDDQTRDHVLQARVAVTEGWTEVIAANLLAALTKLAAQLHPVTAESLRACVNDTVPTMRTYWIVAICLAVFVVSVSVATFVTSAISANVNKDITAANELAVKLTAQLESPTAVPANPTTAAVGNVAGTLPAGLSRIDVITELQTLASTMRAIDARTRQMNWFILRAEHDPLAALRRDPVKLKEKLQLPVPLPLDLASAANDRIQVYQDVRSFAQGVGDDVSVFYGAITTCVLPVLYALLGTCAYLLRSFEQDMSNRTFTLSHADSPRFLIAAIGGAVVGLFNSTLTQGASIPPLAIAFLVGYAVDVFFSFLEGLIQAFTKSKTAPSPQPAGSKP